MIQRTDASMLPFRRRLAGYVLAGVVSCALACEQPIDPGSDLPDDAPPAQLGPQIDTGTLGDVSAEEGTDVTGSFDIVTRVESSLGGSRVPIELSARIEQNGELNSGEATVGMTLRPPNNSDASGASTDQPADVSKDGAFEATISGYTVPASTSEMLASDTDATVRLESQIVDSNCIRGDAEIMLMEVESPQGTLPELTLTGPFTAEREGESCRDGGSNGDAGTSNDTGDVD